MTVLPQERNACGPSKLVDLANLNVKIWSDADWSGDHANRKSTSGSILTINNCVVAWASKKRLVVTMSTMRAKCIAGAHGVTECGWIRLLLKSALKSMKNGVLPASAKHIALHYHYVKDDVAKKNVEPVWFASKAQRADILTKVLA
ncbi:TPA: hypothetical protein N0F65_009202 [Lagenidium giganteum]|uniref:LAGLIDADG endonuclease n=1 Tax=Lagenidium giganteum TaxID=4803 RepID=A0AAV2YNR4_9STRA|nr:TPA: hypothetical protein N0F65_009202 [Lagenidium giganteum]